MTEKKVSGILLRICITLTVLYAISFAAGRISSPRPVRSALLNPKYADRITGISVTGGGQQIVLSKQSGLWTGTADNVIFPAESKTIKTLIDTIKNIRNMYIISDSNGNDFDRFSLSEQSAVRMDFMLSDGSVCSSIYFGANNYNGRRIYCRQPQSHIVYETDDDIFPWLKTDPKNWADMRIVPQSVTGTLAPADIQRIRITGGVSSSLLTPQNPLFAETVQNILSARAGAIFAAEPNIEALPLYAQTVIDTGDGTVITLSVYETQASAGSYYVIPRIEPGLAHRGTQYIKAVQDMSYALEISGWTLEKLIQPGTR